MNMRSRMSFFQSKFTDRHEAGQVLAERLRAYADRNDVLILALPRGGVPVAYEVAKVLHAPLDIFLVRKLGVPGYEELAMGAIAAGGIRILNEEVVRSLAIPLSVIDSVTAAEQRELERRERIYRGDLPPPDLHGRVLILIDDGLATGSTMLAAVAALKRMYPARIVIAVPVATVETCAAMREYVDEVICAVTPEPFYGVGGSYRDFSQTTDAEVRELLVQASHQPAVRPQTHAKI